MIPIKGSAPVSCSCTVYLYFYFDKKRGGVTCVKTCFENFQKISFHYVEIFPRDGHFYVEIVECRDMNVDITG